MLSRFYLLPERHGQTDRQTDGHTDIRTDLLYQYRASVCWRAIKTSFNHEFAWSTRNETPLFCFTHAPWFFNRHWRYKSFRPTYLLTWFSESLFLHSFYVMKEIIHWIERFCTTRDWLQRLCCYDCVNLCNEHIKATELRTIIQQYGDWYTGRWWVGCYIWYSEEGPG